MAPPKTLLLTLLTALLLPTRTLAACGSYTYGTCADGITHWYDPDTGEICDPLDCGGGRAPVKTDVPGCAAYKGTLTRPTEASYMPCFTNGGLGGTGDVEVTTTMATLRTTTAAQPPVVTSSAGGQVGETESAGGEVSSSSRTASPSGEARGDETTGAGSASTPVTTAPPASTPAGNAGGGSGGDEAGSTSTTASEGGGNIVGASWIVAVAGVAMGALGVL
ncbi:hypothetical protein F5144DRAFT_391070 [Chaetomium tenue]|uniref:Uncharacterized protein n=1 Tax=Chaetomium tenue TaxID=1854479 RepID=A0ACB7NVQ3_9PEZI|nr:hypothetical protein F5144DRAFT_391070 [Chaetomium globosum]